MAADKRLVTRVYRPMVQVVCPGYGIQWANPLTAAKGTTVRYRCIKCSGETHEKVRG